MPKLNVKVPTLEKCCGCVTDLKTASAIIAVLGVVTSPVVSWAIIRHSFVVRVSCFVTSSAIRPDVIDINLNNMLSFGFGANAGLGPSCLGPKNITRTVTVFRNYDEDGTEKSSKFVKTVRWVGWGVLAADIIFLGFSVHFLYRLFRPPDDIAARRFAISCIVAILLSFFYGMLYVGACVSLGGAFPIFEFFFCIVDVLIWSYCAFIVILYIRKKGQDVVDGSPSFTASLDMSKLYSVPLDWWSFLWNSAASVLGYIPMIRLNMGLPR